LRPEQFDRIRRELEAIGCKTVPRPSGDRALDPARDLAVAK
jgi:hypothetical protein